MTDNKSLGQIAFEGSGLGDHIGTPYKTLLPFSKCNWEAAASAVWDQAVEAVLKEINSAHQYYLTRAKNGDEAEAHKAAGVIHVWLSVKDLKRSDKTESDNVGCQASAGAKGETVSATPLHSDIIAEAVRKVSWKPEAFNIRSDENGQIFVSADGQPIMDFPARTALELGEALVTLAANAQSVSEEAQRADTERPANAESSLTQINQDTDNG